MRAAFPAWAHHWITIYRDRSTRGFSLQRWWGSLRWQARSLRIWQWRRIIIRSYSDFGLPDQSQCLLCTQTDDDTENALEPEKAKEHHCDTLEQEIKEINIAIDNQIEGYKMAVDEILRMKMSSEAGKKEHFPDYFEYLPDKFNQHFITGRNIVREMRINRAKKTAAAAAAAEKRDDDGGGI